MKLTQIELDNLISAISASIVDEFLANPESYEL